MDIISTAIAFPDGMIDDFKFHYYENNSGPSNTINLSEKFNLYPNPSSDIINIASNYNIKLIEVIDKLGRIMFKKENSNKLIVNCLSKGIYSVNIYFEDKKITKKFTKLQLNLPSRLACSTILSINMSSLELSGSKVDLKS